MSRYRVGAAAELLPGKVKIIQAGNVSVGVFNVEGEYYALRNVCPHKLAPLCVGPISGVPEGNRPGQVQMTRKGEIVRCPWHGWEFEIKTGRSVFNPHRVRVKTYPVHVDQSPCHSCMAENPDPVIPSYPITQSEGQLYIEV